MPRAGEAGGRRKRALTAEGDSRPLALLVLDRELRCRLARKLDPEWQSSLFERAAVAGTPLRDVVGEPFFAELEPSLRRGLAGTTSTFEILDTSALTAGRSLRVLCTPQFDAGGSVDAVQVVLLDITRLRQREARARLRERQFFEAQRLGRIGHWQRNLDDPRLELSDEHYRILGLAPGSELTDAAYLEMIHPDDRPAMLRARDKATRRRRGYDYAFRIVRPDGEVRWLAGRADPIIGEDGRPAGYFGVTQDVTAQRAVEQANARFLRAIEQLSEGIALYDAEDHLVLCNAAYQMVAGHGEVALQPGISFEEVLRRRYLAARGPDAARHVDEYVAQRLAKRPKTAGVVEVQHGRSWYRVSEERLADGSAVIAAADITQQKDYERQLRLAQHNEALGRVAGGIAHELNNVLTAINAGLELIKLGLPEGDRLRAVVERSEHAASRGAALSRSMLAYGRQQFLRASDLNLNAFIRQHLPGLQAATGQGVVIDTLLAGDLASCRVDAEQLLAALLGLVENARDAMPAGGRICIVTANQRPDRQRQDVVAADRDFVMLALTDNGVGIPPGVLDQVFDPFFTTKEVGEGSGLGLSMVQGFMHQSGGDIEIESTPGLGTTIRLYLPAAADTC